jgi:hypothetical protein
MCTLRHRHLHFKLRGLRWAVRIKRLAAIGEYLDAEAFASPEGVAGAPLNRLVLPKHRVHVTPMDKYWKKKKPTCIRG